MKLDLTGRNIEITPAIRDFTADKLSKLDKWIDDVTEAHAILSVEKHRHIAEIVVKGRHHVFTGTDETGDLYASIGNVVDKIEKQARRLKDKATGRRKHARPAQEVAAAAEGSTRPGAPTDGSALRLGSASRIIRSNELIMKPMSPEDAALEFVDSQREFLVFRDSRSQRISVMYRRKDGNLGLIEPQA
ncbi:MAG TPA: ribosome-associated translation inhibitor RaiA [Candidatus Polarisedimenticolia bacterium]|jgi:putative sigma-54 modulation protein